MITPHETSTNLQWVTIHGVRQLKMKPAPKHKQLPKMEKSKEGPPFAGCNTKVEPETAAQLRRLIVKLDRDIARHLRKLNKPWTDKQAEEGMKVHVSIEKQQRSRLQAERAFIMEQANPKREPKPKPKKRHMRKTQPRFRKEATHETA